MMKPIQTKEELKKRLTSEQYSVTQEGKTENPYTNKYYKTSEKGVYKCIVCDLHLFTSDHKFDSGCGWPAFWDQIKQANIKQNIDDRFGMKKIQLRCNVCDSHLGHLFTNGSKGKHSLRYCINSASMNFEKV